MMFDARDILSHFFSRFKELKWTKNWAEKVYKIINWFVLLANYYHITSTHFRTNTFDIFKKTFINTQIQVTTGRSGNLLPKVIISKVRWTMVSDPILIYSELKRHHHYSILFSAEVKNNSVSKWLNPISIK
jgi:hypothetical protein